MPNKWLCWFPAWNIQHISKSVLSFLRNQNICWKALKVGSPVKSQDLVCIKFSTCFSVKWWNSVWKEIINGSYSITFTFHLSLMANKIHHFFLIIFNNTLNRTTKVRVVFNNIVIVNILTGTVKSEQGWAHVRISVILVLLWFISFNKLKFFNTIFSCRSPWKYL